MKMMKIVLVSGALILTAIGSKVNAQSFASNESGSGINISESNKSGTSLNENEVNRKAINDFLKRYKTSSDATWTLNGQKTSVYFTNDDIKMRSTYDKKGRWEYTLSYYNESKLPVHIRQIVKSTYYDMAIILVTEVQRKDKTIYFVKMEDSKSYLTVKILNEEMVEFEKLDKI